MLYCFFPKAFLPLTPGGPCPPRSPLGPWSPLGPEEERFQVQGIKKSQNAEQSSVALTEI